MTTHNYVLVLDTDKRPLSPCHPARARELLTKGKAAVFRRYPFTLILKRSVPAAEPEPCQVKLDPGSKTSGVALVQGERVVAGFEIHHRGALIRKKLQARAARRRQRRSRLRYRQPSYRTRAQINNAKRAYARRREKGGLPPSIQHRIETTMTWLARLRRWAPVGEIVQELVRFDTPKMMNPEVSGTEYQQGELAGFEVKEYLLQKWSRQCAYCGAENVPLEVEHITAKSRGGSDRVSNLTVACTPCNRRKGHQPIEAFLKDKPKRLARIQQQAKAPLKDVAAVNASRWALFHRLNATGLPVSVGSGALTKFNRKRLGWCQAHWIDAAAVGAVGELRLMIEAPLSVTCKGQGGRQKGVFDRYGQPRLNKQGQPQIRPLKPVQGWRTGDIGRFEGMAYRITPRSRGCFELRAPGGKPFSKPGRLITPIHRQDGYEYATEKKAG